MDGAGIAAEEVAGEGTEVAQWQGRGGRPAVARRGDEDAAVTSWAHLRGRGLTGRRT